MMSRLLSQIFDILLRSLPLQFLFIVLVEFITFYKIFNFPFHANREIGWILQLTGREFNFISLMKSHGFISYFNYLVFGINPSGWYLTGLILHILAVWMVIVFFASFLKSRALGFAVGILFGVSTAWHDVITIGSAYSMYSAQLLLFLASLYFYKLFREQKQSLFYFLSLILFFPIIPLRDSGIFFLLILVVFDFIFFYHYSLLQKNIALFYLSIKRSKFRKTLMKNKLKTLKSMLLFLAPVIPYILIVVGFLLLRNSYGASPYDFNDHRARLMVKLISEGQYAQYIKYGVLGFFYSVPPQIIHYPFLNFTHSIIGELFGQNTFYIYFYSILGSLIFTTFIAITYMRRRDKSFRFLLFFLLFIVISSFFYSFAITLNDSDLMKDYGYDEHRWRYVYFLGVVGFIVIFFRSIFSSRRNNILISGLIISVNLLLNITLLWSIQDDKYENTLKYQKLFYKTIFSVLPLYKEQDIVYFFPYSYQLRDYLEEWHNLAQDFYPGIKQTRLNWAYEEFEKVLISLTTKTADINRIFFIDFDQNKGVVERTSAAKKIIKDQKYVVLLKNPISISDATASFAVKNISPVEIPYKAKVKLRASLQNTGNGEGFQNERKFKALIEYARSHFELSDKKKITVCNTSGGRTMYNPEHLIDGNLGTRSVWHADCGPDWFIIDLQRQYSISGFLLGGLLDDTLTPSRYMYEVSLDGKTWKQVMLKENNNKWEMMDKWDRTYEARYIRVTVFTTQRGGFVQLDEAEPILANASDIFTNWKSRTELMLNLQTFLPSLNSEQLLYLKSQGVDRVYVRFYWKTNLTGVPEHITSFYFPMEIDGEVHEYEIPINESEAYSWPGQFLQRYFEKIGFDFGNFPGDIEVQSVELIPKIPVSLGGEEQSEK